MANPIRIWVITVGKDNIDYPAKRKWTRSSPAELDEEMRQRTANTGQFNYWLPSMAGET
jgi:hypothetical protein